MGPPTINTSIARAMYSASARPVNNSYLNTQEPRTRSLSTASTSSTISLVTPAPSSGNPSSSSLDLPTSSDQTTCPSTSSSASEEGASFSDEDQPPDEYVLALHDFVPQQQNATCLAFRAGDTIRVLNRDPSGWWDGEIDGRRGWFPSNYVNAEVSSLTGDELPTARLHKGHGRSKSDSSFVSGASTASPPVARSRPSHDSSRGELPFPASPSHTPPLMIPLLHGLQLLQNTTHARRISHYQPAVACIIQCIRALLQQTECLARGAPLLMRFPALAQERKRVLAELALLVTQSKKASSSEYENEDDREPDEEHMLRLAGQVFARVRRFLAVAVQCGVELPERSFSATAADTTGSDTIYDATNRTKDSDAVQSQYGFNGDDEVYYPISALHRTGSVAETRYPVDESYRSSFDSTTPLLPNAQGIRTSVASPNALGRVARRRYHGRHMSFSSSSSFSSFSSLDSPGTPPTPPFPEGLCSAAQVQQTLRATHDSLLSTIAAFIGHVHAHSRAAHPSSTGHLFALVRQIVDIVCKLLTIVDAVMGVNGVPSMKRIILENAKEHLYQMACVLADAVRDMASGTGAPPPEEEEERGHLLKVATDALKAGSDCVSAVKTCLARPLNAPPFIIMLPPMAESSTPPPDRPAVMNDGPESELKFHRRTQDHDMEQDRGHAARRASAASGTTVLPETLDELHEQVQMGYATTTADYEFHNEDITIQVKSRTSDELHIPIEDQSDDDDSAEMPSGFMPENDRPSYVVGVPNLSNTLVEEEEEEEEEEEDHPSPTSQALTDTYPIDDASTWEGSQRHNNLENKIINGDLPLLPQTNPEDGIPLAWALSHDYAAQDVAYNSEGHLVGATFEALVEKMTPHDQIVDAAFSAVFFHTFRLFSSPTDLAEALVARFSLVQPNGLSEADVVLWQQRKLVPVRLRVSNFLRLWLEAYWRGGADDEALPVLNALIHGPMAEAFATQAQRLEDLINTRQSKLASQPNSPVSERQRLGDRLRDAGMPVNPSLVGAPPSEVPRVAMTKALLGALRAGSFVLIAVTDFDALELARQMTLLECSLYCAISAEEMLEIGMPGASPAVNVKAVSALSTAITGWVSESILGEQDVKRRIVLVKFFIKVADRCTTLNNFSTPRSILAALDSATISRLHQTWAGLAQKSKVQLEALRRLADHARNYHEYRLRLRNTAPPAVPFLGLYLTDLTFCREGNPSHRASPLAPEKKLLNFNKYHKLARIVQDMQRFQVPYHLKDIPEAQSYLQFCLDRAKKEHGDLEDLYRRSQLLEPKQAAETPTGELKTSLFSWGGRSQTSSSQTTLA
ncbi:hypothetical protein M0805_009163 [Coniferiporia weirii]|nr:hypothetical protein M0805_009163 [Coniferiporia weirii]